MKNGMAIRGKESSEVKYVVHDHGHGTGSKTRQYATLAMPMASMIGRLKTRRTRNMRIRDNPSKTIYCPTLGELKSPPFRRQLQHFFFFTFGSYDAYGNTWSAWPSSEIS
jgi:hypothetical protein